MAWQVLGFMAIAAAGTLMSAKGQIEKGKEAKRAAEEAARLDEMDAKYAVVYGEDQVTSLEGRMKEYMGGQRQTAGVSNVRLEGSPLEQLLRTISITENDIGRTRRNVAIEVEKLNYRAAATRRAGSVALSQSRLAATASILSGIGSIGTSYYSGQSVAGSNTNPISGNTHAFLPHVGLDYTTPYGGLTFPRSEEVASRFMR